MVDPGSLVDPGRCRPPRVAVRAVVRSFTPSRRRDETLVVACPRWSSSPRVRPPYSARYSTPSREEEPSANETNHPTQRRSHHLICHHRCAWGSISSASDPALRDALTMRCDPFRSRPCFRRPCLTLACRRASGRKLRCIGSGSLCRGSAAGTHASLSTRCRRSRPRRLRPSAPPTPRAANRGLRHRRPAPPRCMRRHLLDALAEGRRRVPRCGHRSRWAARRRVWRPPRPVRRRWPPHRRRSQPTTMFATAIQVPSRSRWSGCDG